MATKIDNGDELLKCPICFERFTTPKCLPCLHTFCQLCLKSYIVSQLGGEGKMSKPFPCPVCRQTVQVTDTNLLSENIADIMPENHLISSLIKQTSASVSQNESTCDPCKLSDRKSPAVTWCVECGDAMCDNCTVCHRGLKQTRNHQIVSITDASKKQLMKLQDVDEPCMTHSGKVLEVYCIDHKQMCCVICLATQHRKCENISTFDEMVKGVMDEESVEDFFKRLDKIEEKTEILKTKVEQNVTTLQSQRDEMSDEVSTVVETAIDKLRNLKDKFLSNLNQTHKEQNAKLAQQKDNIETFQNSIKRGHKMMEAVCDHGSPLKQVFITKEKLKSQMRNYMDSLKKDLSDCKGISYVLKIEDAVNIITNSLESVAKFDIKLSPAFSDHCNAVIDAVDYPNMSDIDIMDLEVAKVKSLDLKGKPQITGGTFLSDGRLVLCNYDKNTLMLYDEDGNYQLDAQLNDQPWDAVCVKDGRIVVSFHERDYLKNYEIKANEIKENLKIPCKQWPRGLAVINDNLVVSYESCIDVMQFDGTCLKSITRSYSSYGYVAALDTGSLYHIENNAVVCLSQDGTELFRYGDAKLKYPAGLALDRYQNVFVCDNSSGNIHVVSRDGEKNKVVLQSINRSLAIGFDRDGKKFFISALYDRSVDLFQVSVKKRSS